MNSISEPLNSTTTVVTVERINEENLTALFNNEICILRVPNYCSTVISDHLAHWLVNNEKIEPYFYVKKDGNTVKKFNLGVERVGLAYNATYARDIDASDYQEYYMKAGDEIRNIRKASQPYLSPVDNLRLELDENWPFGANVANFEGKKMFVGVARIMQPATAYLAGIQPHCDSIPSRFAPAISQQFSANIYLEVPPHGGEFEIWDIPPIPHEEVHKIIPGQDWRSQLPSSYLFKPTKGDLILFNTRRPHAIQGFPEGVRVNLQFFIGLQNNKSLALWT